MWVTLALSGAVLGFLWKVRVLRSGALASSERRGEPVPAPMWLIAAVVSFLALSLGGNLVAMCLPASADPNGTPVRALLNLCGFAGAVGVSVFMAVMLRRASADSGLTVPARRWWLGFACLPLALPFVYFAGTVSELIYSLATSTRVQDPIAHPTLQSIVNEPTSPWAWVMILTAVVLAPIHEELVYRGFLQTAVVRAGLKPWPAIMLTSALFALMHRTSNVPWYAIGTLFMLSVCLGFAFERSRSIAVPIAMHMGFNALNVVIAVVIS